VRDILTSVMNYLIPAVEACGAAVIVLQVARSIVEYVRWFVNRRSIRLSDIRLRLGQSLVMGLEFQVAADILKTGLSRAWDDILQLAALIALRTLLNYVLERELETLNGAKGGPKPSLVQES
jgi:uncharacterized membrane protein